MGKEPNNHTGNNLEGALACNAVSEETTWKVRLHATLFQKAARGMMDVNNGNLALVARLK